MASSSDREYNAPKDHYTAVIEIHHSTPEQVLTNSYKDAKTIPKQKREITRVVVRDKSIEKAIEKAKAHLDLVEDNLN